MSSNVAEILGEFLIAVNIVRYKSVIISVQKYTCISVRFWQSISPVVLRLPKIVLGYLVSTAGRPSQATNPKFRSRGINLGLIPRLTSMGPVK